MKKEPNDFAKSETANPVFDKQILRESLKFLPLGSIGSLGSLGQSLSVAKRRITRIPFDDIFDTDKENGN
jgi:hypothetical protein